MGTLGPETIAMGMAGTEITATEMATPVTETTVMPMKAKTANPVAEETDPDIRRNNRNRLTSLG